MNILSEVILRTCLVAFGCAAVVWGVMTLPTFWREAPIERIAGHVIANERFTGVELDDLVPSVEATERAEPCRTAGLRAAVILRLRMAEYALSTPEIDRLDDSLASLRDSIRRSLGCSPDDAFLWLNLFWVDNTIDGFSADHLAELRMSYVLGPNEAWVALKRSPFALALYDQLPPDLADMAQSEFVRLIESGFVREATEILTHSGWRNREALLPRLKALPIALREALARAVYDAGYDVDIPGVKRPDSRPWR